MSATRRDALAALAAAALTGGWAWPWTRVEERRAVIVAGSTRMLPYNRDFAEAFAKSHFNIDMTVEGGGAYPALLALRRRSIDIAAISRELTRKEDDPQFRTYLVACDAVAIIVNPKNPVASLRRHEIRDIFEGQTNNWGGVGGRDGAILLLDREGGDPSDRAEMTEVVLGHREAFKGVGKFVASDEEMVAAVAADPDAIGYCGWEDVKPEVRALAIDGVPLTRETILSQRYRFAWPYYYVTAGEPGPAVAAFLKFIQGPEAAEMMAEAGLVKVY